MLFCLDRYSRLAASVGEVVPPNLTAKVAPTLTTLDEASGALSTVGDERMSSTEGNAGCTMSPESILEDVGHVARGVTGAVVLTLANVM
jgi:hypothetical protein